MTESAKVYRVRPVKVTTHVPAGPDEVFSYVSDTRNDPEWCPNVTDVRQVSGDGVELGAGFEFHQSVEVQGRELVSEVEVEVVELGESHIRWRVEDRFQVRDVLLEVARDGDGTKVTQTTTAIFKRKPGLAKWFYPRLARRTFRDQFQELAGRFT
ncbi:MAG TPA: SRPBCC family protein [Acidimicrobiia bacterium]|nr:SRPBCC family protein [Acidimicrobiia bacterium]